MMSADALTGAYNRYSFEQQLERIKKNPIVTMIVTIDLNNLKIINDKLGHEAGDKAIKAVADYLMGKICKGNLYRTGGDEFVIISDGILSDEFVYGISEKDITLDIGNTILTMCISVGKYDYKGDSDIDIYEAFNRADKEMYINKSEYKKEKFKKDLLMLA